MDSVAAPATTPAEPPAGPGGGGGGGSKRPAPQPPPQVTHASRRTKKNARGRRSNQQQQQGRSANGADANGGAAAGAGAAGAAATNDDLVRVVPVPPDSVLLQEDGWRPVRLSATDHAPQARVDPETGTLASTKGYCTARGTHGASAGTWFFEVELTSLGGKSPPPSTSTSSTSSSFYLGAARVGWATRSAELQAPVGYDKHGYAFRDREGSKVHDALREPYLEEPYLEEGEGEKEKEKEKKKVGDDEKEETATEEANGDGSGGDKAKEKPPPPSPTLPPVKQGDVIGCYLHLPPGGRALERTKEDIVSWKGGLYFVDRPEAPAAPVPGSAVAFYLNGRRLGVAFADILEGTYYPAGSLFTPPPPRGGAAAAAAAAAAVEKAKEAEKEPATSQLGQKKKVSFGPFDAVASFNFGPRFRFPPAETPREGLPEARPACEMAGPPP